MAVSHDVRGYTRPAVEAISYQKAEPAWMRDLRLGAWDVFERTSWPTMLDEEWRKTDIRGLKLDAIAPFAEPSGNGVELPAEISASGDTAERGGLVVQRDSLTYSVQVRDELKRQGVVFCDLDTAVREFPELVQRYFLTAVPTTYNRFAALHTALWSGGSFVYVPRDVDVKLPLQASFWAQQPGVALFPHTLVVAERGSRVTYIDQYLSTGVHDGTQTLSDSVVELRALEGSEIRYISLQQLGEGAWHFGIERARVAKDAKVNFLVAALGSTFSKTNADAILEEQGAETEMLGFYFADRDQFFDHHTLQDHVAPHTTSDLLFKGALTDVARSMFAGLIRVHEGAQKTNAYQNNRNLLLSKDARANSEPKLEIGANDVRCTHGATAGPVEELQIFYLMCRGIPRVVAERLIVEGFFDPVLQRVPLDGVRERLRASIDEKVI